MDVTTLRVKPHDVRALGSELLTEPYEATQKIFANKVPSSDRHLIISWPIADLTEA